MLTKMIVARAIGRIAGAQGKTKHSIENVSHSSKQR
jgi:rRNA processing protein Krr1/Pno1